MRRLYLTLTLYLLALAVAAGADLSPLGDKYGTTFNSRFTVWLPAFRVILTCGSPLSDALLTG